MAEPPVEDYSGVDEMVSAELGTEFRIERALKHGRTSHVYFARDTQGRDAAIKVRVLPAGVTAADAERFAEAARTAAGLEHPNITRPYCHGTTDTLWWYAMAYVPAPSVAERLASGMGRPLDVPLTWRMALQVASALDYAHRRSIAHGALKPTDVLLDDAGWVHVVDTGLGEVWGAAGEGASPLADQCRLALIVRECLTGAADTAALPPGLAPHVAQVLQRALAPEPRQRFAGVLDFVAALTGAEPQAIGLRPRSPPRDSRPALLLFDPEDVRPRRRGWRRVGLGVAVTVTGGVLWLGAQQPRAEATLGQPPERVAPAPPPVAAPSPPPPAQPPPPRPTAARPTPRGGAPPRRPGPGYLSVNTTPWGVLSIDGRAMGTTPRIKLRLAAGAHRFRVQRAGFKPYDAKVVVREGETVLMTNIRLAPAAP